MGLFYSPIGGFQRLHSSLAKLHIGVPAKETSSFGETSSLCTIANPLN